MRKHLSIMTVLSVIFMANQTFAAEQGEIKMAENGFWNSTKEVTSDVWDGTKNVTGDVWDGAKKVTGDVYDGAKKVGSDIGDAVSSDDKAKEPAPAPQQNYPHEDNHNQHSVQ